ERPLPDEVRVVYVSPLKALSADIHKNLAEPRRGIRELADTLGINAPRMTAAVRTGDTTSSERAAMLRTPPHILVTTPESLYLLLTSARSREMLRTVRAVIVDEIHAVIGGRRGAHLALSLERLERLVAEGPPEGGPHRDVGSGFSRTIRRRRSRSRKSRGFWSGIVGSIARSSTRGIAARSTSRSRFRARRSMRSCRTRYGRSTTTASRS
ncbi:MAG: DEAD/DEAH box helicase, partial [Betaproteobacteria bacterium]